MKNYNKILKLLHQDGYRHTPAREAILNLLEKENSPVSAEEIFLKVKELHPSTNLSTIYRTLDLFSSKGILNKVVFQDGKARYEMERHDHRHHMICLKCNKSIPIDTCPLHLMINQMEKDKDFSVTDHNLELYGYCSQCKKEL